MKINNTKQNKQTLLQMVNEITETNAVISQNCLFYFTQVRGKFSKQIRRYPRNEISIAKSIMTHIVERY